ncbi:hypothetical protein RDABS01_005932 [Bienertia sinuspersici]
MLPHPCKLSKASNNADDEANNEDLISNLTEDLTDKILRLLPLSEAAKLGVLSKTWHNNWSCITSLCFDYNFGFKFWKKTKFDLERFNSVINNILLLHQGLIHGFLLCFPNFKAVDDNEITLNLRPWLCFLSRNGVKKITLDSNYSFAQIPSQIYMCKDLEKLILKSFFLIRPPTEFKGGLRNYLPLPFTHLNKLALRNLDLTDIDIYFCTFDLLQSCPSIKTLNISVGASNDVDVQQKFDYDNDFKLGYLREVNFKGFQGSLKELTLIEYLLYFSNVLQRLFLQIEEIDDSLQLKVQKKLNGF